MSGKGIGPYGNNYEGTPLVSQNNTDAISHGISHGILSNDYTERS
jgi:hypothetical protein